MIYYSFLLFITLSLSFIKIYTSIIRPASVDILCVYLTYTYLHTSPSSRHIPRPHTVIHKKCYNDSRTLRVCIRADSSLSLCRMFCFHSYQGRLLGSEGRNTHGYSQQNSHRPNCCTSVPDNFLHSETDTDSGY